MNRRPTPFSLALVAGSIAVLVWVSGCTWDSHDRSRPLKNSDDTAAPAQAELSQGQPAVSPTLSTRQDGARSDLAQDPDFDTTRPAQGSNYRQPLPSTLRPLDRPFDKLGTVQDQDAAELKTGDDALASSPGAIRGDVIQGLGESSPLSTPTPLPPTLEMIRATHPLPVRDLFSLAQRLGRLGGGARRVINPDPPEYQVGDRATFWISEQAGKTYFEITATLRYIGEHAAWWMEDGVDYNENGLIEAAKRFDQQTYPTNRRYFGDEWLPGVDNDPRVQIVNGRLSRGIGGYYSSSDEYPDAINPHSNQREVIYINLEAYAPGDESYDAVIAHEFQHMIHWYNDPNESTWVDEGLSELAVYLNGYGRERWISSFAREPDTQLNAWSDNAGASGAHYGASSLFMRYFAERFGHERVRSLVASDEGDILGLDAVLLDNGLTFDDVFRDWVVANYVNDESLAGGRYGYPDVNIAVHVATTLGPGQSWGDVVRQYGTDYLELRPDDAPIVIRFKGVPTIPVLATQAHSGEYFFWSNRGDGSVMSLTRAFDLSETNQATLEAWLWYDIEEFFDFAYVEISTDNGVTWQILPGRYCTTENPTGNGLGPGYSGRSLSNGSFQWVKERIDLTSYAGQKILIRWEQITDDGYNAPGLAIDDIAIPEIGYFEDFEDGDGGWKASGFVRIDNVLPQYWALQLIELGDTPQIRQIPVYEGRATLKVNQRSILAISAMTPFTTEPADYSLWVD